MHCLFSGEVVDSVEHVVPQWLQRRFKLHDRTIVLPNGTALAYKHLKVPAASAHNSAFGAIEDRISRGHLDPLELYLWALKLHVGLICRDASLRTDIRDPQSPMILDISRFDHELWLFRQFYKLWRAGGTMQPSPPGTVLVVDSLLPRTFDLFHCMITGTIGINVGRKFIVVFLWDQGDGQHAPILQQWLHEHVPQIQSQRGTPRYRTYALIAPHVWACEAGYWLYRNRRSYSVVSTDSQLTLLPPMTRLAPRPPAEEELRIIARNFALELVHFGGVAGHRYAPFSLHRLRKHVAQRGRLSAGRK